MRIDTTGAPACIADTRVAVGDVYPITGGGGGEGRYSVVLAIRGSTAYELKFTAGGEISGVGQSGLHYLERKMKIGHVDKIPDLDVDWFGEPFLAVRLVEVCSTDPDRRKMKGTVQAGQTSRRTPRR